MRLTKIYQSKVYCNYWYGIVIFGLLIGFGLIIEVLLRNLFATPISQPVSLIEIITQLVFMFIGVYIFKINLEEKKITFKKSYMLGLGSGIVGSIIYGMFLYVYALYLDKDFSQRCYEIQRNIESNSKLTDQQVMDMATPSLIAFSGILLSFVVSILLALIVAILLRNEKGQLIKNT